MRLIRRFIKKLPNVPGWRHNNWLIIELVERDKEKTVCFTDYATYRQASDNYRYLTQMKFRQDIYRFMEYKRWWENTPDTKRHIEKLIGSW